MGMFASSMDGFDEERGLVCFFASCMVLVKKEDGYVSLLHAWS